MRINKYHFYLPIKKVKLACGRDHKKVGGLIGFFFEKVEIKDRCKICQKAYKLTLKGIIRR